MKRFSFILALLCALTANAFSTDIAIGSLQTTQIPFNPSNLGNTRTFTVTATSGSAIVTSAALFPTTIVGKSGFTISIGGVFYTVAAVPSTSSLTLTKAFTGSTGSTTLSLYPYTLFRAFPTAGFQSSTATSTTATIAVTNGSATVTSAALFPTMYTGVAGGYQVLINGNPYQVLWQASTSSLVLTQTYAGSTGAATMTFDGVAENVQPSAPGGQWFKEVAVSVVNLGSGNVLYYPSFVMPATTNATVNNQARYVFAFYRPDNSQLAIYQCGAQSQLAIPTSTPTTWTAICTYNSPGGVVPPNAEVYTKSQIDQRFPSCTAGQSYYFAANGNIVSCLNFGSGLTLTGNTLTASGGGGSATNVIQGYNAVLDGLCDNTGVSDATTCLNAAVVAANTAGRQLFLPAGTYDVCGFTIAGLSSQRIFGEGPGRTIIQSTCGTSPALFANNASGLTHSLTIEELSLNGFGSGASDYGFRMSPDQPFDLTMRNVRINNTNSGGIYIPTNAFTMLFDGVDISTLGGNGFDIGGDNTVTLMRTYVHSVGTGGAAYRLHSGRFTLLGANGIDSGTSADWGVFGDNVAQDGVDQYARVMLIGSNVEAFTRYGLRAKAGSQISVHDTNIVSPATGTVTAILLDNMTGINPGIFDGLSGFNLSGAAAWTNGAPINSNGVPFLFEGVPGNTTYYDTAEAALVNIGYRTTALNGTADRFTQSFNRLAVSTGAGQGFDGNLPFIDDNTRTIGLSSSSGRPSDIYVGTGGVHVGTGAATVDGQNWTITGGANPLLNFADGTVAGRFQLTTGTAIQFGTTTSHPLNILTAGTNTWQFTDTGNLIVVSGSRTIGTSAGNRPSAIYGQLFDSGISGTSAGVYIFRNGTNSNTLTLQGGVSTSSFAITLPTTLPGSTECLQIGSTGIITPTGSACGGSGSTGANPTASVGLTAVNGVATTFLRSDGAPALSQAIIPTWTGAHTFTATTTAREIDPQTDNTYDLGTTSLRWKTVHVGPGSVVVHNDATNTLKATLGFSGSTAKLFTDSATPLQLATGSNNGLFLRTDGTIGYNLTGATSGNLDFRQLANGNTVLYARRATDSTPTGNFLQFQNAAAADVFAVDITGSLTAGTIPAARVSSGTIAAANGGTGQNFSSSTGSIRVSGGVFSANTETGTGNSVLATSPTLTTPVLGAATATSINGLTITSSTGTLTVTNGKTASFSNSITFAGTDSTTMTFPSSSDTLAGLATANVFTVQQTITGGTTSGADRLLMTVTALGSNGTRTSPNLIWQGSAYDGTAHTVDWRARAVPSTNAGASSWQLQNRIDAASFASKLTVDSTGVLTVADGVIAGSGAVTVIDSTGNLQVSGFASGSLTGNGTKLATSTGTLTSGRCAEWDANGNIVQSSGACGIAGAGYTTIQEEGSSLTARVTMNFVGSSATAADDAGNTRTNITFDSDLNALASNSTNGFWAAGTNVARSITGTTNVITVTNGAGIAGDVILTVGSLVVRTDQANTYSTGAQSFSAATSLTLPVAAGAAPTANGVIAFDSTANDLEYGDNGTNRVVANLDEAQTLTNKTLTTPTIASFTNAAHNHTNAAGGGQLTDAALSAAVGVTKGGTGLTSIAALSIWVANSSNTITTVTPAAGQSVRINAGNTAWEAYTPSSGGTPGGSNTQLQYNNSSAFGGISGATSDGTNVTYGSANLRATSPRITTDISDSSGNEVFKITATGSAINEITVANAATGTNPSLTASSSSDSNVGINLAALGTGKIQATAEPSSTNTTDTVVEFRRNTSGTPANNIGIATNFLIETSSTANTLAGGIGVLWKVVDHNTRNSRMFFNTVDASQAYGERMGLDENGIRLPEISSSATPSANNVYLYAKDNGSAVSKLYYKGDDGVEVGPLAAASVTSVTATNATLTISPTTGAVLAGLNLANANTWTALPTVAIDDSGTTTTTNTLDLQHSSSSTPAAGFGAGIRFGLETSSTGATTNQQAGLIKAVWGTSANNSRQSYVSISGQSTTTVSEVARFQGVGNSVNYFDIYPSATGQVLALGANGTDTNIGIDLQPKGSGVVTIVSVPILTETSTATVTNKTIADSSNVLGSVTMDVTGTDADGDIYYRASNVLTRLPKGTALQELRMNAGATAPEWATPSGSGITTLNTLTATTQTFATGTSGSDFNISSATSTHTFNIPDAGASARGLVTTGTQTFAGAKTFSGAFISGAGFRTLRTATATNYTITAAADHIVGVTSTAAARTITLPDSATAGAGAEYTIVDESNAASVNNITIARAGSDTFIGGATSVILDCSGCSITVYSNGAGVWYIK